MQKQKKNRNIHVTLLFGLFCFYCIPHITCAKQIDSLFANSLFYNSMYDDGSIIDSLYIANLVKDIETSEGEKKVGLLFKFMNGLYFHKPEYARDLGKEALKISLDIANDSLVAYSYHYLGIAYQYLKLHRQALKVMEKGLDTEFAKQTYNYCSWVTFNSGISFFELGKSDSAAQYFYEALRLNEFVDHVAFASKVHLELCKLYGSTGNFGESVKHYFESLRRIDLEKDKRVASELFTERFKLEIKRGNIDSANVYFTAALTKGIELNDSSAITNIYREYAELLFEKSEYNSALQTFAKGLKYVNKNRYKIDYFEFLHGMGKTNLYLGNIAVAKKQLLDAIEGTSLLPSDNSIEKFELSMAKLFARLGDWEKFNHHFNNTTKHGFARIETQELATINELKTIFETEKKDKKIELQNFQISSQKNQLILISGIAISVLLGLFFSINFSRRLKKNNQELYHQNTELSKRWNELQGFYIKCAPPDDETKESKTLFQNLIKLFSDEKIYLQSDLTVELLAKRFSSNVKYISLAIKDQTGMNFNTFINTYRIEDAKNILNDPKSDNLTLEAIAEECGFNNQTSFYQAFKKNTGLTPTNYRKIKVA